jgi:putative SOS response-associated peptidase YedK
MHQENKTISYFKKNRECHSAHHRKKKVLATAEKQRWTADMVLDSSLEKRKPTVQKSLFRLYIHSRSINTVISFDSSRLCSA